VTIVHGRFESGTYIYMVQNNVYDRDTRRILNHC